MHWIYLIHEFHNLNWITEINELFHDILIYWDAPVYCVFAILYIAYLYIILLSSVSCPVAVILLHCGASVTLTNSSYV